MKIIELFAGIGACSTALKRIGIDVEIVDAVEIDKYAMASFNAIHGTKFETQDITNWNKQFENIDLITHGSPCQDFSVAGKQAGGDLGSGTRSSLMYETIRIVGQIRPKYVLWENVKNVLSKKHKHNFDAYIETMNVLGYNNYYQVLNAKDYGIPQNRERVYTISIRKDIDKINFMFPNKEQLNLRLKDMLEDEVDEKYYLKDYQIENIKKSNFMTNKRRIQEKDYCDTLCARDWKDPKCVQVGNLSGGKWDKINESCRRFYSEEGLSPTIHTCQGGNTEPKVAMAMRGRYNDAGEEIRVRKDIKQEKKYCEYCGKQLERKRFNGRLEDFTVFKNRKYCNRECMKRAFLKIGENKQTYSNAHTTARKINELILHKEVCEICGSDANLDIHHIDGNWQNNNLDNLMCLCRSCHTKYERNKDKIGGEMPMDDRLRIRKLTPKECWRL